ncbi:uncharacterized protein [Triticum aestivum]|nr:uncharacterized protein LOC123043828 [Triticum aestivum]
MASSTLRCLPGDIPPTTLLTLPEEMLEEILLCLSDAADLVRASMARVSIRRLVTNHRFLRRFRTRHPPPLLGIVSPYPLHRWDRPLLNLAQPPHPSAAAASAFSGLDAADFSCTFLPNAARWRRDLRDGRVLLSGLPKGTKFNSHAFVRDLAVSDPLSRRYILLPPIPDDLAALVQPPDLVRFDPFLAPPVAEDEDGMSFRVICLAHCTTKLVLLIFSSSAGQWHPVTLENWIGLLTGSDNPAPGNHQDLYWLPRMRHYAHGYFCWAFYAKGSMYPVSKLLMLDTQSMGFSAVDLPPLTDNTRVIILEAENGRIGMYMNENLTAELRYYVLQNDGVGENQWLQKETLTLNDRYMLIGVAGGYLLLQGLRQDQYPFFLVSLDLKTLELEWFLASRHTNVGARLFASFPPSLSPPTLRHDI